MSSAAICKAWLATDTYYNYMVHLSINLVLMRVAEDIQLGDLTFKRGP
jgi:hypothetical protein